MTVDQLRQLLGRLTAAYPWIKFESATFDAYVWGLRDLPVDEVEQAMAAAIKSGDRPPAIADIRHAVVERRLGLPDAGVALEMLEGALRENDVRSLPEPIRRALAALGGPYSWRTSEDPGVMRGQFRRLYEEFRAAAIREVVVGQDGAPAQLEKARPELSPPPSGPTELEDGS